MANRHDPAPGVSQLGKTNSPLGRARVSPSNIVEGHRSRRPGVLVNVRQSPTSVRTSRATPGLFFSSLSPSGAPPPSLSSRIASAPDSNTPKTAPVRRTRFVGKADDERVIKDLRAALRKENVEEQAAGSQGDALEAKRQALLKKKADLVMMQEIKLLEAEVQALEGDASPPAKTEPRKDHAQSGVSQPSAEDIAKALEALKLPRDEAKTDDQTRVEGLLRRLKEKRFDFEQGEVELLTSLLRGGLTSTKVTPAQPTQTTSHPIPPSRSTQSARGLTEYVKSAVSLHPSDRSVEEFNGQELAKKMASVRSKVLVDAVESMPSVFRFLGKFDFIGSGPYGAAGALLLQQIVAIQAEFEHRADGGWSIVQHYLFQLFRLVDGVGFTDARLFEFIMEGQARLANSTAGKDYLKSLDETLFSRAKDKAFGNAPLDPEAKPKKDQSSKGGDSKEVKKLKKRLRNLLAAQGSSTDGQQPTTSGGKGKDRKKGSKKQQGAAPGGASPAADSE